MKDFNVHNLEKLINYISINEKYFEPVTQRTPYNHMGATITDAILQAGVNYRFVVYPRIARLLKEFNDYRTTCDFLILIQTIPLEELISWRNEQKINRIKELSWFLYNNKIETEIDLANWLNCSENINKLRVLNGIGPKTIDYLKMLSGNTGIAIDRHLFKFLTLAGIFVKTYNEAHLLYCEASQKLGIERYVLDRKVWNYMSNQSAAKM